MAIAFDSATQQADAGGISSLTFSHTCSGSDRILFVGTEGTTGGSDLITGITYASVAMTRIGSAYKGAGGRFINLFYLIAPSTGANNIVISASGVDVIGASASSYTGVNQSSQPDAFATATATASTLTGTVTTVADNCWTVMFAHGDNITAGAGTTVRATGSGYGICDSNGAKTPAGSTSLIATPSASWSGIIASFAPVGGGGGGTTNNTRRALLGVGK